MAADKTLKWSPSRYLAPVEMDCPWCAAAVPLAAGEFCGVCIDCGMVLFREPVTGEQKIKVGHSIEADAGCLPLESEELPVTAG